MAAYYNEIDPFAAAWLRNLIAAGLIPDGEVDERSILDVRATDLRPFRQHHFFAGIGGWPHALDLAGWSRDRPVWTGSPPCQPLSSAGQRRAHADERHLWPAFYELVAECRPATLFGEQVASKLGREWFAGVRADLEQLGYGCGGADLPAACVGAPHIRQRLFWVALADADVSEQGRREQRFHPQNGSDRGDAALGERADGAVALSSGTGSGDHARAAGDEGRPAVDARSAGLRPGNGAALRNGAGAADADGGGLADTERGRREHSGQHLGEHATAGRPERHAALDLGQPGEGRGAEGGLADAADARRDGARQHDGGSPPFPARLVECGPFGGGLADAGGDRRDDEPGSAGSEEGARLGRGEPDDRSRLGNTAGERRSRLRQPEHTQEQGTFWLLLERPGEGRFRNGAAGGMADPVRERQEGSLGAELPSVPARRHQPAGRPGGGVADAEHAERGPLEFARNDVVNGHDPGRPQTHGHLGACGDLRGLADAERDGGRTDLAQRRAQGRIADFWATAVWLECLDGKARRIEPSIQPLATGIPNRVGLLRGSGNSIVPQAAAVFVTAVMEAT